MSVSASELADMFEWGDMDNNTSKKLFKNKYLNDPRLEYDLKVMQYRHELEKEQLEYKNRDYQPDCLFRDYDWDEVYGEKYVDHNNDYISTLRHNLRSNCTCSDCNTHPN